MDLHVFAEGAGVSVGLPTAQGFAVVGLGAGVDLRVLLPVAAVGEAALAELTLERLLPWMRGRTGRRKEREARFGWLEGRRDGTRTGSIRGGEGWRSAEGRGGGPERQRGVQERNNQFNCRLNTAP